MRLIGLKRTQLGSHGQRGAGKISSIILKYEINYKFSNPNRVRLELVGFALLVYATLAVRRLYCMHNQYSKILTFIFYVVQASNQISVAITLL